MLYQCESPFVEEKQIVIPCNICKKKLDVIINIFLEKYKLDVFGFHKEKNQYWGKDFKNKFFFLITIQDDQIFLNTKIDETNYFPSFYKSFMDFLEIY
jgi:hypothetical protein